MKIKLICWTCKKEYEDVPLTGPYKCECGGYVVSPSGKVQGKWVDEDEKVKDSDSPTESSAERVREEMRSLFEAWDLRGICEERLEGYEQGVMLELIGLCEELVGINAPEKV